MLPRRCSNSVSRLAVVASLVALLFLVPVHLRAQDDDNPTPEKHGRKYKAPPETSHIEVLVIKGFNRKPIVNAAVIFHPVKDGRDEGNLEVKTNTEGKALIDVVPTGSNVRVQVIADGFATFADDYVVTEASRQILVVMVRPRAQVSAYVDNSGKPSELKPGVQDPIRPKAKAGTATPPAVDATPKASSPTTPAAPDK